MENKEIDMKEIDNIINEIRNNPDACTTFGGSTSSDGTLLSKMKLL